MATGRRYRMEKKPFEPLGYRYETRPDGSIFVYHPDGYQVCGARRKKKPGNEDDPDQPCLIHGKTALSPRNGRCKYHGGKSVSGTASGLHKDGRYSKYLPPKLNERYREALDDEDLLSTRQDIALVDAHISNKLTQLQHGESADFWKRLMDAWADLMIVYGAGDMTAIRFNIEGVNRIIRRAAGDQKGWVEVMALLGHRNKLVESERKYLVEMGQMVSVEDVMTMLGVIQDIIGTHVDDQATIQAIGRDFLRLTSKNDNQWIVGQSRKVISAPGVERPE